ncbi:MAG TPA: EAL domain-containing protein [Steroidobacteraceae bacterium]|jgi:diguanylate cyclase (GGDEF)-like protein|nr:EAL domain-containing protein [Steroidobacteraceae bacterium]
MYNGRHLLRRQYVRLKGWLTLGSIGIMPRLILAFVAVGALAATANLIVENGVAILEQQRNVALERSTHDARQITALRESMERARLAAMSAEVLGALGDFDRAVQEHADADSRGSAARFFRARSALDRALAKYLEDSRAAPDTLTRLVNEHKNSADAVVHTRRVRRDLLTEYSTLMSGMDIRVRTSMEQSLKVPGWAAAREPLLEIRARLDSVRAAFAARNAFDARELDTGPLAKAERALAATLRERESTLRRALGTEWFHAMTSDTQSLTTTRVGLFKNEERRLAASDAFAAEPRTIAALLPAPFPDEVPEASVRQAATVPAAVPADPGPNRSLVAWVSAAVLVVLLYLCVATIFSIVRPVRRLLSATNRLARGENARVVESGGIRELDTLTSAFNSMAQQLAVARDAARDAQQKLEAKVEERTRQLQELAEQDPLTGIANRRQLFVALNEALDHARVSGERIGVFFLDIDNFKTLNDSMGHSYGDRVLVAIARRLEALARDRGFAARLGGDEFTVVQRSAADVDSIVAFGTSIVRAFETPLQVDDREVIVSVSVGASVFPDHERDAEALLRAADAALFRAKALGRSRLATFTPELVATASAKFAIEQKLRRAIQGDEFELFYQPLVDTGTLDVVLVEALLRWRAPDGTYRAPDEFLAVAEESGVIMEISDWVLRTAIGTAARWHRGPWPKARVAINVSARQFLDYRFVGRLEELLREYDLPARCLELELTESVLQTGTHTIKTLDHLRSIGVAIALDDFGTGYSSLASLQRLPLTRVKLDRSLVAGIDDNARSASIARATIALCRGLGLEVTAEGVERLEQLAMLLPHRAISLQGFLFARPVSANDLLPLLKSLPAHCRELDQAAQKLPAAKFAARGGDRRKGALALVSDRQDPT